MHYARSQPELSLLAGSVQICVVLVSAMIECELLDSNEIAVNEVSSWRLLLFDVPPSLHHQRLLQSIAFAAAGRCFRQVCED